MRLTKPDREWVEERREIVFELDDNGDYVHTNTQSSLERRYIDIIDGLETFA